MRKKLSPRQSFLLLYLLSAGSIAAALFLPNVLLSPTTSKLFYGLPYFILPFIIIIATFFVVAAIPRTRIALGRLEMLEKYSPKHFLLLLWLTAGAFLVGVALHNGIYGLGIVAFGEGFWAAGDEPVFFMIAIFVVPAGFIVGAIGRMWEWAVARPVEEMKARGVQLPSDWRYFAPFGCYIWLWRFGKGIEVITEGRMGARRVFAAVFFLGVIGFVIIQAIIQRQITRISA